jgi:hypothetical protein
MEFVKMVSTVVLQATPADLPNLSTNGLQSLHDAVLKALAKDDELTKQGKDVPHGCREFADWRTWSNALEAELARRGVPFTPVPW